jgi:arylsulfatase A-like enzyme
MNVIFICIDSLNRHFLQAYGQPIELAVAAPNLERFAAKAAVFDTHYAGSLPCMPARREYFAGIQEFLWRPWGPMEPFDVSLALAARRAGAITQLVTDHYHYFQYGSHGYFNDYHGFEFIRGHEYDAWRTQPIEPDPILLRQIGSPDPQQLHFMNRAVYARNVAEFQAEEEFFAPKVFRQTADWLTHNHQYDKWLLVVDSFDVHEPFHLPEPYASLYTDENPRDPALINWPYYGRIDQGQSKLSDRQVAFVRSQFAGKVTMVDRWLGQVLDKLDALNLWQKTMVIITADHGHYLGDHGWMGKPNAPMYNTLTHIPLFIWHPHSPLQGRRIPALTSAVDLYATILNALEAEVPAFVHSRSLVPLLLGQTTQHRDWAIYGYWGSTVNVTNGRYTYLHPCREDRPADCYSTMFMNPHGWFQPIKRPKEAQAGQFLPYTEFPVWRYQAMSYTRHTEPMLFDVQADPAQMADLAAEETAVTADMRHLLHEALQHLQAPESQFARLGLE